MGGVGVGWGWGRVGLEGGGGGGQLIGIDGLSIGPGLKKGNMCNTHSHYFGLNTLATHET